MYNVCQAVMYEWKSFSIIAKNDKYNRCLMALHLMKEEDNHVQKLFVVSIMFHERSIHHLEDSVDDIPNDQRLNAIHLSHLHQNVLDTYHTNDMF